MIIIPQDKIASYKAKGWWGETRLQDLFARNFARDPGAEAAVDPLNCEDLIGRAPQRLSWEALDDLAERYAAVLTAHGIGKDDALVVQLPNLVDLPAIYLACCRLGVIVSPTPVQYRENELAFIAASIRAKGMVSAARIAGYAGTAAALQVKEEVASLEVVFSLGETVSGSVGLDAALAGVTPQMREAAKAAIEAAAITADDIVTICWTSGTEARPKGVPRNHNEWLVMGEVVADAAELETGDRMLNPFPMVNMAGISTGFVAWLMTSGTLVQHHPFDLGLFLRQIQEEKVAYTVAPPAILNMLLQNEALVDGVDFSQLRNIGSGSAPLSEWMVRGFKEKFGIEIANYFGSNEGAAFPSTYHDFPDPAQRAAYFPRFDPQFTWKAVLHDRCETRLVDPATEQPVSEPGVPGELRMKGPSVFAGYWENPEATARVFDAQGWFRTGDMFEIAGDKDQFYRFVGRCKDIIIRGGQNISSEEIEGYLLAHPAVADVAIVGEPDEKLGERLCAFVVFKPGHGASKDELNRFLREEKHVAVFKQIERLEEKEQLPRNPVGKLLKRELRAEFA